MDFFQEWLADLGIDSEVTAMESNQLTDVILEGEFDAFQWGWYVEPDPDSILSCFLCDARGGWSDSWYCNEEYDQLYEAQNAEVDDEKRVETIKQMQEILFHDSPYLVTAYTKYGQALRTDRFACFQPQPDPGGVLLVQYGAHNYTPAPPGRRGRRLRRRRRPRSAPRPSSARGRRRRRQHRGPGRAGRRGRCCCWSGAWCSRSVGGRRPASGSDLPLTTLAAAPAAPRPVGPAGASYGRYVLGKVLGALGSLCFVLVVNFFLFRVLPGDPARTLTRGRVVTEEQLDAFREQYGLDQPLLAAVPDLPEEHPAGRPGRLASATTCRSRS